jgi:uncharacterized protein YdeI (YjbR/CyaY-like superfamily)
VAACGQILPDITRAGGGQRANDADKTPVGRLHWGSPTLAMMMPPTFFRTPNDFRQWLDVHAASAQALLVGYHKVGTGVACMSWTESVDEALCHGWIDGVRKRIDEATYSIRFTPRKPASIWSAVNIAKVEQLRLQGRMTPAGLAALAKRTASRSAIYSHEQHETAKLLAEEVRAFESAPMAWAFFEQTPPSYKKRVLHWVCGAKRPATRSARLNKLIEACAAGLRLSW